MTLTNRRGRIRCYLADLDCRTWADRWAWMPTEWSVMAKVPVCDPCLDEGKSR